MGRKIKLVYFDIRGRAEITRLMLHHAGVEFEDERIAFADWPKIKPSTPAGSLPYIEIDEKAYVESVAIHRWAATHCGLIGKDEFETLQCDAILSLVEELRDKWIRIMHDKVITEEQRESMKQSYVENQIPKFLARMEKTLVESESGYFVGDNVTLAEFAVFDVTELPLQNNPKVLDSYPKVAAMRNSFKELPNIKKYLSARKVTHI